MATRKASSTEVVTPEPAGLPELVQTSREDFAIDASDIQPPRIKAASPASGAVANELVRMGSLFTSKGQEDDSPVEVVPPVNGRPDLEKDPEFGLKVYVVKMYKNKAASVNPLNWDEEQRQGGELRTWAFDDPYAPQFARTQYNYVVFVPDQELPSGDSVESDMPHNLLLKGTSISTARFINTLLAKRQNDGLPIYTTAFRLHGEKRERNDSGQTQRWAVIKAREVAADQDEVQQASRLAGILSAQRQQRQAAFAGREVENDQRLSEDAPAI